MNLFGGNTKSTEIRVAAFAAQCLLNTLQELSKMDPTQAKRFLKLIGIGISMFGGAYIMIQGAKQFGDAKVYRSNKLADAEAYTIEREADAMLYREKNKCMHSSSTSAPSDYPCDGEVVVDSEPTHQPTWIEWFHSKYTMPELPLIISRLLDGSPEGYEDAMLLHLLSMFGSMCFSKVRSVYLDKAKHAPNLQVIIEGNWGTGKAKFEQMYKVLFERIIHADIKKINKEGEEKSLIIQTSGIGTSMSKLVDILASNQGCHSYIFNSEVRALANDLKKANGLNFDYLRKAFENGDVCRNNKAKDTKNGIFPIFLNYTITGTPADVQDTFKKELEGGTLSRIWWTTIPEGGREPGVLQLPEGKELEILRDKIDDWRNKYCFTTSHGDDVAVQELEVNLDYVNSALKEWAKKQFDQAEEEGNSARKDVRLRVATIAFHCAIVLHMLWGDEQDFTTRNKVKDLTLYIADYCMERFLFKFGEEQNRQRKTNLEAEQIKVTTAQVPSQSQSTVTTSSEKQVAIDLKALYDKGYGQKKIAKEYYKSDNSKHKVKTILEKYYPDIEWNRKKQS